MLLYATILRTTPSMGKREFIDLVKEWNDTHRHAENIIPDLTWNEESGYGDEHENLRIQTLDHQSKGIIAVRYEKSKDGAIWKTDYVFDYASRYVTIQLSRDYAEMQINADQEFSAPHFITLLIEKGYLEPDSDLPICRTPIMLTEQIQDRLKTVILGESTYDYPIVFVSKTHDNADPVDVAKLATLLKGLAHVIVENDVSECFALRSLCKGKEEYWGDIGIYFPNKAGRQRHRYRAESTYDEALYSAIRYAVYRYANQQAIQSIYTWSGLRDDMHQVRNEEYRQKLENVMVSKGEAEEALKALLSDSEYFEHAFHELEDEKRSLLEENRDLNLRIKSADMLHDENKRLRSQLERMQQHVAYPDSPMAVAAYCEAKLGDRLGFTDRAQKSLKDCVTSPKLLWNCFHDMATMLRDLYMNGSGDIYRAFNSNSKFEAARGETSTTRNDPDLMKLRKDTYNGEPIDCETHIKKGNNDKDPNSLRVYYAYSTQQKKIIVSFCNGHLETAGSKYIS